ncbi:MAG: pectate lyase, partial [Armatimonadota bacterium]|nr:pectate lyase [Armatimonadota bacterium]
MAGVAALLLMNASVAAAKTITVAADGSGDFKTVQEAINAVPDKSAERTIIRIKPGTYKEKLTVPGSKGPITFLGDDAATTILTFSDHAKTLGPDGKELGTSKSASILIQAPDFHAENITFENSAGPVGQAVAVNVWSDRGVFRKCRFLGWQDTLLVNRNRQYFEDCYISGHVDYIFGASAAWFERCELHCRLGGAITAASTPQEQPYGYVFSNCKITAAPSEERQAQNRLTTVLGRPWRPYASVIYLNTEMSDVVAPAGWDNWGNAENEKTARYAEYRSSGPGANPAKRVLWSKQLTDEEAKGITMAKVFGDWNPVAGSTGASSAAPGPEQGTALRPLGTEQRPFPTENATTPTNATLTPERIAALPADQRAAWQQYLERSAAHLRADKAALDAELKANNLDKPIPAPEGEVFKVTSSTPAAWFASDEARRIADAIVSFQTPSGGWSKAVAFDKGPRRPGMHWITHSTGWSYVGTFDNRATTEQMVLLAKVHQATKDEKYAAAFLKGLDYTLDAQFPNGGWPQVYPLEGGYHDAATFNDDLMVHVLEVLRDVANGAPEFAFMDDARRAKAREAVAAGVRFILQSQVVQNGRRTVWGAQHDPLTLAPAAARKFEPASLSGGESLAIVRFLMSIEPPTPEIMEAVQAAVAWFDASKITGIEVVKKPQPGTTRGFDTVVVENPAAPPIWARFYELGTNRPIFIGRDAVIRYNLAEIDEERRTGYAWYVTRPKDLLEKEYPAWQAKWAGKSAVSTGGAKVRIVLVGDSTVAPNGGWGPAFAKSFGPQAEVINLAAGGRSSKSFRDEGRWQKALEQKPDYILIQFGHNDQPGKGPERETDPNTTYYENMARYVDEARAIGAKPILVTSLTRRHFTPAGQIKSDLVPYVEAVTKVAADKNVPLLDLHARSIEQLNTIGPQAAAEYDRPGDDPTKPDRTHLSEKGG